MNSPSERSREDQLGRAHLTDGHCILLCLEWIVDGGDAMQHGLPILTNKADLGPSKTKISQAQHCCLVVGSALKAGVDQEDKLILKTCML